MKSTFYVLLMVMVLGGLSGCCGDRGCLAPHGRALIDGACGTCDDCPETCEACDCHDPHCGQSCLPHCGRGGFNPGPPSAAITYPYYTTRGPRDFLARNPRSIGP